MAVKSLADGRTKLAILATAPADPNAPTVTELTAGIDASCRIAKTAYTLGPTTSDTINDPELCVDVNSTVYGASNYEGTFSVFRYYDDETNQVDVTGDEVYQALKTKGTEVWLVERETAKKSEEAWRRAMRFPFTASCWTTRRSLRTVPATLSPPSFPRFRRATLMRLSRRVPDPQRF